MANESILNNFWKRLEKAEAGSIQLSRAWNIQFGSLFRKKNTELQSNAPSFLCRPSVPMQVGILKLLLRQLQGESALLGQLSSRASSVRSSYSVAHQIPSSVSFTEINLTIYWNIHEPFRDTEFVIPKY